MSGPPVNPSPAAAEPPGSAGSSTRAPSMLDAMLPIVVLIALKATQHAGDAETAA